MNVEICMCTYALTYLPYKAMWQSGFQGGLTLGSGIYGNVLMELKLSHNVANDRCHEMAGLFVGLCYFRSPAALSSLNLV